MCSTTTALAELLDVLYENIDPRNKYVGVFQDLSKPSDMVTHIPILEKLVKYSIRGIPIQRFGSYLNGRNHYVEVNNSKSNMFFPSIELPQDSILSPLLYAIYVNNFPCKNLIC